ncbi:hypothetical protein [Natrinema soli]|uniref:Uncharacterized protein n=1 Tax=Natrinema soli TaxID=1930624 RepID=A0ABD5SHT9_9EURY|nr:hypothetical protein [Natrinema soli]
MGERDLAGLSDSLANPGQTEPDEDEDSAESEQQLMQSEETSAVEDSGSVQSESSQEQIDATGDAGSAGAPQSSDPSRCQEITREGTQCDHEAQPGSKYCKKHQPDKFGNRSGQFQRKQWNLLPEVSEALFEDSVTSDSLYIDVQKELGENFQKKSVENKMGEFLLANQAEFIEFMAQEFDTQE